MAVLRLRCVRWLAPAMLVACSEPADVPAPRPPVPGPSGPVGAAAPADAPLPEAARAINAATFAPDAEDPRPAAPSAGYDPMLVKAQVLLDRARFSPGVVDGRQGENVRQALAAFEQARGLPADGALDEAVWNALTAQDAGPVMQAYRITAEDVAGPFIGLRPDDYEALAELPAVGYERPSEALAEKFHMGEDLLLILNPMANFTAGETIVVAAPGSDRLEVEVASIEVNKVDRSLRAFDAQNRLVAFYPASVGSTEYPAPSGSWGVRAVAPDPTYYYNPDRLTFGRDKASGRLEIKPGPNNPVGSVWIDLTRDTYGIHGSPDPESIGKDQSHGCVRLTNWDAAELASGVKAGTKVDFLAGESGRSART